MLHHQHKGMNMVDRPQYVRDEWWNNLIDALMRTGRFTYDEAVSILCFDGNLWPHSILRDVIRSATAEAEIAIKSYQS
jgi:hypothetical protein